MRHAKHEGKPTHMIVLIDCCGSFEMDVFWGMRKEVLGVFQHLG